MRGAPMVLCLVLVGCAAAYRGAPASASREELAGLQRRIASLRESSPPQATSDPDRCRKLRTVAAEICRCADRICVLAGELADDDSRRACTQARGDCERARSDAEACQ